MYHSVSFLYSDSAEKLTPRDRELYGLLESDAGLELQDWHMEGPVRWFGPASIELSVRWYHRWGLDCWRFECKVGWHMRFDIRILRRCGC